MIEYSIDKKMIVGKITFKNNNYPTDVIALYKIQGKWKIGSSMCLPVDFKEAKRVLDCFNDAFKKAYEVNICNK
jgi:hypothetical protein